MIERDDNGMAAATEGSASPGNAADAGVHAGRDVMDRDTNGMITYEQIAELSEQTSLPLIEIIRALARCAGDSEAARTKLMDGGHIDILDKKGIPHKVHFMDNVNSNVKLHAVGASYGVKKLTSDAPHWSATGH